MAKRTKKKVIIIIAAVCVIAAAGAGAYVMKFGIPWMNTKPVTKSNQDTKKKPVEAYRGIPIPVGNEFTVKLPLGWSASVSTDPSFFAVIFARPGKIDTLIYDTKKPPAADYAGIPAWSGLTEHFYIRSMTDKSKNFNPADHAEVKSEKFTFDDGTVGTKYLVTKHAAEAKKYGGLLKDNEWYGRVFVYEKGGKRVEAHLAFYPSTKIDESFFTKVAKSVHK